jgi:transcriptional regulator with XRE-family HTH domain
VGAVYEDPAAFPEALKRARTRAGLTQEALADALGISAGTVKRREKGELGSLGATKQKRWTLALQVAEVTGQRALLGLTEEGAADGDLQLRVEALESELLGELGQVRSELADVRSRLERAERNQAGSGN